jgi:hypothetical protein
MSATTAMSSVAEDLCGIWECSLPCAKVIEHMFDERVPRHVSLCVLMTHIDRTPAASLSFPWARAMTMSANELTDTIQATYNRFHNAPP